MENASKALIIAGAILIAILLIGIGMYLYSAAQQPISEAGSQMDEQASKMFNSKFEAYDGQQSGTNVKLLISAIITNNSTDANSQKVKVTTNGVLATDVTNKDDSATLSTVRQGINNSHKYTVTLTYTKDIITGVTIKY